MTKRSMLIALRLFFGVLSLAAVVKQFTMAAQSGYSVINFFSYFTILSNIFAAIVLIFGAFQLITHRRPSALTDLVRGISVVNMAIVIILFVALLRNVEMENVTPWISTVHHYITPIVVVLDWLFQPPSTKLGLKHLLLCQVFPLLYNRPLAN